MPDWELVSFVKASQIRLDILILLNDEVLTPTELKTRCDVPISRISAVLKELVEKKLIKNLTPDRRKSKMFGITSIGKEILENINSFKKGGD